MDAKQDTKAVHREFKAVVDAPAHVREWTKPDHDALRQKASLDEDDETPSGRHHAERVLELLDKAEAQWEADDVTFAERGINYARRSAGIAEHHPHHKSAEVADSGLTKNEIARRNWGLPAQP